MDDVFQSLPIEEREQLAALRCRSTTIWWAR
jgi:hypothetical protein